MGNNLPSEYDAVFLEQAQMGFLEFNVQFMKTPKMKLLKERQRILNETFVYSPEVREKVIYFIKIFTQKCKEAVESTKAINDFVKERMTDEQYVISDFDIDFNIDFFSQKKYEHSDEMEGVPFFVFSSSFLNRMLIPNAKSSMFDEILEPEFTAHSSNHPLQTIKHSF